MAVFNNILAGAAGQTTGGGVAAPTTKSLRFNSADSAELTFTPSSAPNRKTWTFSTWTKLAKHSTRYAFLQSNASTYAYFGAIECVNTGKLSVQWIGGSILLTDAILRDTTAWYHIVVSVDTTQATQANRVKVYINGVEQGITGTYPNQNVDTGFNSQATHRLGSWPAAYGIGFADFYLADVYFTDGQALAASDFGEYNSNNVWQPKTFSGTYGTHGWHLDFSDDTSTTTIAEDSSGNGNDWTASNISVTAGSGNDSLLDSPDNNYATLNPLDGNPSGLSNGNLDATSANAYPTIFPGSGQWYYEVNGTGYTWDGTRANFTPRAGSHNFGQRAFSGTPSSGYKSLCTANLPDPAISDGSTAMDAVIWAGDGTSPRSITGLNFSPDFVWTKNKNQNYYYNLYDVIRGTRKPLHCDNNLAEDASNDAIYGGLSAFNSDGFSVATGNTSSIWANQSGHNFVGWAWDGGSSTVTNTDGDITSSVRANTSAGFSIVSYTGVSSSTSTTIGHGLNAAPEVIFVKNRDDATSWQVYHASLGASKAGQLDLNYNFGSGVWNNTEPTSSVFSVTTNTPGVSQNLKDYIAYCWTSIEGYSKFSKFVGNGSADGPFVYTGFRPRWILIKRGDGSYANWRVLDTARRTYNPNNKELYPSLPNAEATFTALDVLSNGFKLRTNNSNYNTSSVDYLYMAFAEHPFKTARAF